ncbi:hypothetical protein IU433_17320 [Nocardia puris]|uniref:WXG100-like domain-containing protein n=1 Tax=Nocardia puris TaxID=208602 RepID=UPI0018946ACD|nr:hypothetical protein [Nocardia puris]MBF6211566.1 hypothetical protein [Nocardia puris]MBF6366818.1 hypothetical protein [Nocardia puris]MBF6460794.1 hypothetical protein [Nocardia puris]
MSGIPGYLAWLEWVAGSEWPHGDEDGMWALADAWKAAAEELREIADDLDAAKSASLDAYPNGDGGEEMRKLFDSLRSGPQSLEVLAANLERIAGSADSVGTEIDYAKLLMITSLALLALEIALAWIFPPTAPAVQAAAITVTRMGIRAIATRLMTAVARWAADLPGLFRFVARHVALDATIGLGQEVGIQAWQMANDNREDFKVDQIVGALVSSAASGAAAGPFGDWFGRKLGDKFGDSMAPWMHGGITGGTAGLLGGGAGYVAGLGTQFAFDVARDGWDQAVQNLGTSLNEFDLRSVAGGGIASAGMINGALSGASRAQANHYWHNRFPDIYAPTADVSGLTRVGGLPPGAPDGTGSGAGTGTPGAARSGGDGVRGDGGPESPGADPARTGDSTEAPRGAGAAPGQGIPGSGATEPAGGDAARSGAAPQAPDAGAGSGESGRQSGAEGGVQAGVTDAEPAARDTAGESTTGERAPAPGEPGADPAAARDSDSVAADDSAAAREPSGAGDDSAAARDRSDAAAEGPADQAVSKSDDPTALAPSSDRSEGEVPTGDVGDAEGSEGRDTAASVSTQGEAAAANGAVGEGDTGIAQGDGAAHDTQAQPSGSPPPQVASDARGPQSGASVAEPGAGRVRNGDVRVEPGASQARPGDDAAARGDGPATRPDKTYDSAAVRDDGVVPPPAVRGPVPQPDGSAPRPGTAEARPTGPDARADNPAPRAGGADLRPGTSSARPTTGDATTGAAEYRTGGAGASKPTAGSARPAPPGSLTGAVQAGTAASAAPRADIAESADPAQRSQGVPDRGVPEAPDPRTRDGESGETAATGDRAAGAGGEVRGNSDGAEENSRTDHRSEGDGPEGGATRSTADDRGNPARLCLAYLKDVTGSEVIRVPDVRPGLDGMHGAEVVAAAGGELRPFTDHEAMARRLRDEAAHRAKNDLDDRVYALVIDDYGAVGQFAYVMSFEDGDIIVREAGEETGRPFPPRIAGPIEGTYAVLFDSAGTPLHPLSAEARAAYEAMLRDDEEPGTPAPTDPRADTDRDENEPEPEAGGERHPPQDPATAADVPDARASRDADDRGAESERAPADAGAGVPRDPDDPGTGGPPDPGDPGDGSRPDREPSGDRDPMDDIRRYLAQPEIRAGGDDPVRLTDAERAYADRLAEALGIAEAMAGNRDPLGTWRELADLARARGFLDDGAAPMRHPEDFARMAVEEQYGGEEFWREADPEVRRRMADELRALGLEHLAVPELEPGTPDRRSRDDSDPPAPREPERDAPRAPVARTETELRADLARRHAAVDADADPGALARAAAELRYWNLLLAGTVESLADNAARHAAATDPVLRAQIEGERAELARHLGLDPASLRPDDIDRTIADLRDETLRRARDINLLADLATTPPHANPAGAPRLLLDIDGEVVPVALRADGDGAWRVASPEPEPQAGTDPAAPRGDEIVVRPESAPPHRRSSLRQWWERVREQLRQIGERGRDQLTPSRAGYDGHNPKYPSGSGEDGRGQTAISDLAGITDPAASGAFNPARIWKEGATMWKRRELVPFFRHLSGRVRDAVGEHIPILDADGSEYAFWIHDADPELLRDMERELKEIGFLDPDATLVPPEVQDVPESSSSPTDPDPSRTVDDELSDAADRVGSPLPDVDPASVQRALDEAEYRHARRAAAIDALAAAARRYIAEDASIPYSREINMFDSDPLNRYLREVARADNRDPALLAWEGVNNGGEPGRDWGDLYYSDQPGRDDGLREHFENALRRDQVKDERSVWAQVLGVDLAALDAERPADVLAHLSADEKLRLFAELKPNQLTDLTAGLDRDALAPIPASRVDPADPTVTGPGWVLAAMLADLPPARLSELLAQRDPGELARVLARADFDEVARVRAELAEQRLSETIRQLRGEMATRAAELARFSELAQPRLRATDSQARRGPLLAEWFADRDATEVGDGVALVPDPEGGPLRLIVPDRPGEPAARLAGVLAADTVLADAVNRGEVRVEYRDVWVDGAGRLHVDPVAAPEVRHFHGIVDGRTADVTVIRSADGTWHPVLDGPGAPPATDRNTATLSDDRVRAEIDRLAGELGIDPADPATLDRTVAGERLRNALRATRIEAIADFTRTAWEIESFYDTTAARDRLANRLGVSASNLTPHRIAEILTADNQRTALLRQRVRDLVDYAKRLRDTDSAAVLAARDQLARRLGLEPERLFPPKYLKGDDPYFRDRGEQRHPNELRYVRHGDRKGIDARVLVDQIRQAVRTGRPDQMRAALAEFTRALLAVDPHSGVPQRDRPTPDPRAGSGEIRSHDAGVADHLRAVAGDLAAFADAASADRSEAGAPDEGAVPRADRDWARILGVEVDDTDIARMIEVYEDYRDGKIEKHEGLTAAELTALHARLRAEVRDRADRLAELADLVAEFGRRAAEPPAPLPAGDPRSRIDDALHRESDAAADAARHRAAVMDRLAGESAAAVRELDAARAARDRAMAGLPVDESDVADRESARRAADELRGRTMRVDEMARRVAAIDAFEDAAVRHLDAAERVDILDRAMATAMERDAVLNEGARLVTDRIGVVDDPPRVVVVAWTDSDAAGVLDRARRDHPELAEVLDRGVPVRQLRIDFDDAGHLTRTRTDLAPPAAPEADTADPLTRIDDAVREFGERADEIMREANARLDEIQRRAHARLDEMLREFGDGPDDDGPAPAGPRPGPPHRPPDSNPESGARRVPDADDAEAAATGQATPGLRRPSGPGDDLDVPAWGDSARPAGPGIADTGLPEGMRALGDPADHVRALLAQTEVGARILAALDAGPIRERFATAHSDGRVGELRRHELAVVTYTSGVDHVRQALALAHESVHAEYLAEGRSARERIRTMAREEFVRAMVDEEVEANVRRIEVVRELRDLGYEIDASPAALAIERTYVETYERALDKFSMDPFASRGAIPPLDPASLHRAAHEFAAAAIRADIAALGPSEGGGYADFYGDAWDRVHATGIVEPVGTHPISTPELAERIRLGALERQAARLRAEELDAGVADAAAAIGLPRDVERTALRERVSHLLSRAEGELADVATPPERAAELRRRAHDLRVLADLADRREQARWEHQRSADTVAAIAARDVLAASAPGGALTMLGDHVAIRPGAPDQLLVAAPGGEHARVLAEAAADPSAAERISRITVRELSTVAVDDNGRVRVVDGALAEPAPAPRVSEIEPDDSAAAATRARLAGLRAALAELPSGRWAEETLRRHGVRVEHDTGRPPRYSPERNILVLDPGASDAEHLLALARAAIHAETARADPAAHATDRQRSSRADYIERMVAVEARATALEIVIARQLREAGHELPVSTAERVYTEAFARERAVAATALPRAGEAELDRIGNEAGLIELRALLPGYRESPGALSVGESYGRAWDLAHGVRPFHDRVVAAVDSGVASIEPVAAGRAMHEPRRVDRVRFANGEVLLRTTLRNARHADAHQLVALLGAAVGANVAPVHRVSATVLFSDPEPGRSPAAALHGAADIYGDAPGAAGLGLLDTLTARSGRDNADWTIRPGDTVAAINNHLAFGNDPLGSSPPLAFASRYTTRTSGGDIEYVPHDLTLAQIRSIRARVEGLRDAFAELGRENWFGDVLTRLDALRGFARPDDTAHLSSFGHLSPDGTVYVNRYGGSDRYGVRAELHPGGILTLELRAGPGTPSGSQIFADVMRVMGHRVRTIRGEWLDKDGLSDNFATFMTARTYGFDEESAARSTHTGRLAAQFGFTEVEIRDGDLTEDTSGSGRLESAGAHFSRPGQGRADTAAEEPTAPEGGSDAGSPGAGGPPPERGPGAGPRPLTLDAADGGPARGLGERAVDSLRGLWLSLTGDEWRSLSPDQVADRLADRHAVVLTGHTDAGVHPDVVREAARTVDDLLTRHPSIDLRALRIGDPPDRAWISWATAEVDGDGHWYTASVSLSRDVAGDPGALRQIRYALTHELGHALEYAAYNAPGFRRADVTHRLFTYFSGAHPRADGARFGEWLSQLSEYSFGGDAARGLGSLDPTEIYAEAFAEVVTRGHRASEPARVLYAILEEAARQGTRASRGPEEIAARPDPGVRPDGGEPARRAPDGPVGSGDREGAGVPAADRGRSDVGERPDVAGDRSEPARADPGADDRPDRDGMRRAGAEPVAAAVRAEYDALVQERRDLAREREFVRAKVDDRAANLGLDRPTGWVIRDPDERQRTILELDDRSRVDVHDVAGGIDENSRLVREPVDAAERRRRAQVIAKLVADAERFDLLDARIGELDRRIGLLEADGAVPDRPGARELAAELDRAARERARALREIKPRRVMRDDLALRLGLADGSGRPDEGALTPDRLEGTVRRLREWVADATARGVLDPAEAGARGREIDALADAAADVNRAHNLAGRRQDEMARIAGAWDRLIEAEGGRMVAPGVGLIDGDRPRLVVFGGRDELGAPPRAGLDRALAAALRDSPIVARALVTGEASVELRQVLADRDGAVRWDALGQVAVRRMRTPWHEASRFDLTLWRDGAGTWHAVDESRPSWELNRDSGTVPRKFTPKDPPDGVSGWAMEDVVNDITLPTDDVPDGKIPESTLPVNAPMAPTQYNTSGVAPDELYSQHWGADAYNVVRLILMLAQAPSHPAVQRWVQSHPAIGEWVRSKPWLRKIPPFGTFLRSFPWTAPPRADIQPMHRPWHAADHAPPSRRPHIPDSLRRSWDADVANWQRVQRWADAEYDRFLADDSDLDRILEGLARHRAAARIEAAHEVVEQVRRQLVDAHRGIDPLGNVDAQLAAVGADIDRVAAELSGRFVGDDAEAVRDTVADMRALLLEDVTPDAIAAVVAERMRHDVTEFDREQLARIKDHLMRAEHLVRDPTDPAGSYVRKPMDRLADIAEAWRRLMDGEPLRQDLVLLRDALAEAEYLAERPTATWQDANAHAVALGHHWDADRPPLTEWRAGIPYAPAPVPVDPGYWRPARTERSTPPELPSGEARTGSDSPGAETPRPGDPVARIDAAARRELAAFDETLSAREVSARRAFEAMLERMPDPVAPTPEGAGERVPEGAGERAPGGGGDRAADGGGNRVPAQLSAAPDPIPDGEPGVVARFDAALRETGAAFDRLRSQTDARFEAVAGEVAARFDAAAERLGLRPESAERVDARTETAERLEGQPDAAEPVTGDESGVVARFDAALRETGAAFDRLRSQTDARFEAVAGEVAARFDAAAERLGLRPESERTPPTGDNDDPDADGPAPAAPPSGPPSGPPRTPPAAEPPDDDGSGTPTGSDTREAPVRGRPAVGRPPGSDARLDSGSDAPVDPTDSRPLDADGQTDARPDAADRLPDTRPLDASAESRLADTRPLAAGAQARLADTRLLPADWRAGAVVRGADTGPVGGGAQAEARPDAAERSRRRPVAEWFAREREKRRSLREWLIDARRQWPVEREWIRSALSDGGPAHPKHPSGSNLDKYGQTVLGDGIDQVVGATPAQDEGPNVARILSEVIKLWGDRARLAEFLRAAVGLYPNHDDRFRPPRDADAALDDYWNTAVAPDTVRWVWDADPDPRHRIDLPPALADRMAERNGVRDRVVTDAVERVVERLRALAARHPDPGTALDSARRADDTDLAEIEPELSRLVLAELDRGLRAEAAILARPGEGEVRYEPTGEVRARLADLAARLSAAGAEVAARRTDLTGAAGALGVGEVHAPPDRVRAEAGHRILLRAGAIEALADAMARYRAADVRLPFAEETNILDRDAGRRLPAGLIGTPMQDWAGVNNGAEPGWARGAAEPVWQAAALARARLAAEVAQWADVLDVAVGELSAEKLPGTLARLREGLDWRIRVGEQLPELATRLDQAVERVDELARTVLWEAVGEFVRAGRGFWLTPAVAVFHGDGPRRMMLFERHGAHDRLLADLLRDWPDLGPAVVRGEVTVEYRTVRVDDDGAFFVGALAPPRVRPQPDGGWRIEGYAPADGRDGRAPDRAAGPPPGPGTAADIARRLGISPELLSADRAAEVIAALRYDNALRAAQAEGAADYARMLARDAVLAWANENAAMPPAAVAPADTVPLADPDAIPALRAVTASADLIGGHARHTLPAELAGPRRELRARDLERLLGTPAPGLGAAERAAVRDELRAMIDHRRRELRAHAIPGPGGSPAIAGQGDTARADAFLRRLEIELARATRDPDADLDLKRRRQRESLSPGEIDSIRGWLAAEIARRDATVATVDALAASGPVRTGGPTGQRLRADVDRLRTLDAALATGDLERIRGALRDEIDYRAGELETFGEFTGEWLGELGERRTPAAVRDEIAGLRRLLAGVDIPVFPALDPGGARAAAEAELAALRAGPGAETERVRDEIDRVRRRLAVFAGSDRRPVPESVLALLRADLAARETSNPDDPGTVSRREWLALLERDEGAPPTPAITAALDTVRAGIARGEADVAALPVAWGAEHGSRRGALAAEVEGLRQWLAALESQAARPGDARLTDGERRAARAEIVAAMTDRAQAPVAAALAEIRAEVAGFATDLDALADLLVDRSPAPDDLADTRTERIAPAPPDAAPPDPGPERRDAARAGPGRAGAELVYEPVSWVRDALRSSMVRLRAAEAAVAAEFTEAAAALRGLGIDPGALRPETLAATVADLSHRTLLRAGAVEALAEVVARPHAAAERALWADVLGVGEAELHPSRVPATLERLRSEIRAVTARSVRLGEAAGRVGRALERAAGLADAMVAEAAGEVVLAAHGRWLEPAVGVFGVDPPTRMVVFTRDENGANAAQALLDRRPGLADDIAAGAIVLETVHLRLDADGGVVLGAAEATRLHRTPDGRPQILGAEPAPPAVSPPPRESLGLPQDRRAAVEELARRLGVAPEWAGRATSDETATVADALRQRNVLRAAQVTTLAAYAHLAVDDARGGGPVRDRLSPDRPLIGGGPIPLRDNEIDLPFAEMIGAGVDPGATPAGPPPRTGDWDRIVAALDRVDPHRHGTGERLPSAAVDPATAADRAHRAIDAARDEIRAEIARRAAEIDAFAEPGP